MPEPVDQLAIIGPGRAGLALGLALVESGVVGRLTLIGRSAQPPDHPLLRDARGRVSYRRGYETLGDEPRRAVLLAVPDGAISEVAAELARSGLARETPVLHLSGAFGSGLLRELAGRGHPVGSLHPLVALADAEAASLLRGAWYALEGDPAAELAGKALVAALGGQVLRVPPGAKARYHAAAVAASNFVVALLGVAERWMSEAGVAPEEARGPLCALASGAVSNVERAGPVQALTGPVSRGDGSTLREHLAALSPRDAHLYSLLALSALDLARQRGLDPTAAEELEQLLGSNQ